jgi:Bacterial protein of unknown function (Gcw_chp)
VKGNFFLVINKLLLVLLLIIIAPHLNAQVSVNNTLGQSPGKNVLFFDNKEKFSKSSGQYFWDDYAEVAASLTYASKYVWRGLNLVDDSVLQPELSASKCGFNLAVWGNMDATTVNGHSWQFSEVDIILDYSNTFKCQSFELNYSIGTIHYIYPTTDNPNTWELFTGLELNTYLHPTVVAYYDCDEIKGWYITYGINHTWERILCPCKDFEVGVDLAASVGWGSSNFNNVYYAYDYSSLLDLLFTVSLPTTWKCWEISPFFSASYLTNDSIRHRVYPNTNFWGGVTLSRSF